MGVQCSLMICRTPTMVVDEITYLYNISEQILWLKLWNACIIGRICRMGYSFFIFIFLCVLLPTINWILLYFIILILIWISFIYLWISQFPPDNRNFIFSPRTRILFCKLDLFILSQIMCAVFRWFHHLLLLWIYKFIIWIYSCE